ncbi:MAG: hypothetical protein P8Z00_05255 [Anaerolineales bacterium]|jgi:hypothetical protein
MDIFFTDPTEVPLPPNEVRIRSLRVEPWPDGTRVRVYFEIDPFQKRPNAEIRILDQENVEVASLNVIETMERKMEFTMHLRHKDPRGHFKVEAVLFYAELVEADEGKEAEPPTLEVIDRANTTFSIESPTV